MRQSVDMGVRGIHILCGHGPGLLGAGGVALKDYVTYVNGRAVAGKVSNHVHWMRRVRAQRTAFRQAGFVVDLMARVSP